MRISCTTLELYRRWLEPDQEWLVEDELVANIKGQFVATHAMNLGRAFHAVLEKPDKFRVQAGYRCRDFAFGDDVMQPALAVFDRRGQFEVKSTAQYHGHTVVAKVDQLLGMRVIENKTTLSSFDFDKYERSYQWRFEADIFRPQVVTYNVFCLHEATNGVIELRGIESFHLYPYLEMHADCADLVARFVEYVETRGLAGHLQPRFTEAVA